MLLAGHYQLVRPLGGGGFGQTFLARDHHLPGNPLCVVKQLKPKATEPSTLEVAKRLFDREAETLYRLGNHDQIPRLLAHFEQEHEFYLVQEYIEGHSFDKELPHGKALDEQVVLDFLKDILFVLSFVHQQRVIHRDIKPSNLIRRARDNKIVLIDFGAVKEVSHYPHQPSGQTSFTIAIGSPGYMPSEQQAFHPRFSSDIYAVGIICLQALTGLYPVELPRDAETGEICCAVLQDRLTISIELAPILDKMVCYDYRQRYVTAAEALEAVQRLGDRPYLPNQSVSRQSLLAPQANTLYAAETEAFNFTDSSASTTTQSIHPATKPQALPEPLKQQLERLLIEAIGPITSVILRQALKEAATYQDLVENLARRLPESKQADFREQAIRLVKTTPTLALRNQPTVQQLSQSPPKGNVSRQALDPNFVKQCEQELAKSIGPIAPVIVHRTLSKQPNLSRPQFVELLTQHLSSPEEAKAFRQALK